MKTIEISTNIGELNKKIKNLKKAINEINDFKIKTKTKKIK